MRLGNGDGSFGPAISLDSYHNLVALGDFNGDGNTDVLSHNGSGGRVHLGNGDGSFLAGDYFSTNAYHIEVANVDEDGNDDLVCGTFWGNRILLGNGDGTFGQPEVIAAVGRVVIGDFDDDGSLDIVDSKASVFLGNGDGTFAPAIRHPLAASGTVAAGDFNNDGRLDLLVAQRYGLRVLLNGIGSEIDIPYTRR